MQHIRSLIVRALVSTNHNQSDRYQTIFVGAFLALALLMAQAVAAAARGAPDSFADLAEKLSPAVVNITTTTTVMRRSQGMIPQAPQGSPFEDLFRDFLDRGNPQERPRSTTALGSGFIISADGYIVTNNHVIDGADEIVIDFFDGRQLDAKLIGTDPKTDIALLKVEAEEPLPFVSFGDSDLARVGDWVLAIGNPLGQGFSVSAGIVSARNRSLRGTYDDYIQTDAAINRGNSGGPLFNMDGSVIGVNTAIISPNGGSIGLGFSMSSNVVSRVVDQLQNFGETRRGWLGVRIQDVDPDMAEALGLEEVAGAMVSSVPEGPAQEAGMLAGDVILTFDGKDVTDTRELVRMVADTEVSKAVRVVVFREGKTVTLTVVLGRRENAEQAEILPTSAQPDVQKPVEGLGMTFSGLTDEIRQQLQLKDTATGVAVLEVQEGTDAFDKGIRAGDVIAEVGQQKVESPADVTAAFDAAREAGRKSVLLLVRREGEPRFVGLSLEE
jgi:serine protease Do